MSDIIKRMNSLLSISSHSFVDLITNSSSELFVCDGRKTVEAVKEILQILLEGFWNRVSQKYSGLMAPDRNIASQLSN